MIGPHWRARAWSAWSTTCGFMIGKGADDAITFDIALPGPMLATLCTLFVGVTIVAVGIEIVWAIDRMGDRNAQANLR